MPLYLVRHGKTSWNDIGRAQGHTDIPLNDVGIAQANCLETAFLGVPIHRIYSSDLGRSLATSQAIERATGAPMEVRSDLRERCFGEWEGSDFAEVNRRLQELADQNSASPLRMRPPGGESYADVWERLEPIWEVIQSLGDESIVISSHGGALSVLLAKILHGTLETSRSFRFLNTAITELQRRPDGFFAVARFNDCSHLKALKEEPLHAAYR